MQIMAGIILPRGNDRGKAGDEFFHGRASTLNPRLESSPASPSNPRLQPPAPYAIALPCPPGSFGSRLFEDGERLVAMFGEVLLALDGTVPPASMDGEGGVSQGGEGLGGVAGSGPAGVLAAGPIADVVQAVLDSPMPARDVEQ